MLAEEYEGIRPLLEYTLDPGRLRSKSPQTTHQLGKEQAASGMLHAFVHNICLVRWVECIFLTKICQVLKRQRA